MMDADIRNWPCEESYIIYLARRRKGDPIPQGVFIENPFSSNPWDFPEDSWYLFEESPNEENWEGDVRCTENGFWKWSSTVTISTESTFGFRNVFEFYQGNTPVGTRTGWMMYQYHAGPKREDATHVLENSSLCRLFWHSDDERVNSSRPNNSPSACADFRALASNIKDEREAPSRREADGNVLVNVSQDSFIEIKDIMSSDGEISELYDFSDRDFLEFNDILTSHTASTSSGISSNTSVSSDKYINIDDLLREIMRDDPVSIEEKIDCVSSFTGPVQLDQADRGKLLEDSSMSLDKKNSKPYHHLSNGNYLELRDLLPSNMASRKSSNFGCMRSNSDEYFNAHELLRNIARVDNAPVQEQQEKADCISSFTGPVQLDQDDRDTLLKDGMYFDKENSKPYRHLSNGNYLELRDLLPSKMAYTKSGNLGCMGSNSGEHFNAHELLWDIARDDNAPVEDQQEKPDCRFCIRNSIRSNQGSQTGSESVASCIGNFEVEDKPKQPRNQPDLVPEEGPSTSASSRTGQVKRNLSDRSEGVSRNSSSNSGSSSGSDNDTSRSNKSSSSKTPQSKRRKSVKRLAKIGKKLFCFS